jgi:DNA invertase Pin-like site-specific DNA recombinase
MLIGYARVSKQQDQDTATQVQALKKAGAERIYQEHASGGRWDRPELHKLLDQLRAGDVLVVWKLDRLSRSLKDLLHLLDGLNTKGAGFMSITEHIDTTTPAGRMMLQMVGAFAEFEREMIRERTRAGLETARAQGRVGGRKPKLSPQQQAELVRGVQEERYSMAEAARLFQVHPSTVTRLMAQQPRR